MGNNTLADMTGLNEISSVAIGELVAVKDLISIDPPGSSKL